MKDIYTGKEVSHPMFSPTPPTKVKRGKILSSEEAIKVIRDGDAIATGGFVGTFTAGDLKVSVQGGKLWIDKEGKVKKFIHQVEHITFSGKYAVMKNQPVLYVTERCVFSLTKEGMELIEIAPGI